MVGERMAAFRFGLVGIRHRSNSKFSACNSTGYALIH
jgi:hypothetical protein